MTALRPDKLSRSQIALMQALEMNQTALVDRVATLIAPMQLRVEELHTLIHAALRQNDQLSERIELLERANETSSVK